MTVAKPTWKPHQQRTGNGVLDGTASGAGRVCWGHGVGAERVSVSDDRRGSRVLHSHCTRRVWFRGVGEPQPTVPVIREVARRPTDRPLTVRRLSAAD